MVDIGRIDMEMHRRIERALYVSPERIRSILVPVDDVDPLVQCAHDRLTGAPLWRLTNRGEGGITFLESILRDVYSGTIRLEEKPISDPESWAECDDAAHFLAFLNQPWAGMQWSLHEVSSAPPEERLELRWWANLPGSPRRASSLRGGTPEDEQLAIKREQLIAIWRAKPTGIVLFDRDERILNRMMRETKILV